MLKKLTLSLLIGFAAIPTAFAADKATPNIQQIIAEINPKPAFQIVKDNNKTEILELFKLLTNLSDNCDEPFTPQYFTKLESALDKYTDDNPKFKENHQQQFEDRFDWMDQPRLSLLCVKAKLKFAKANPDAF
ncbi:MAG: hypothetical protein OCD03_02750 [Hyphomicrobiales bacterium]